jgi:transposase
VRREYLVRGRSIREIARELHISRNTVRKILRSGETEFVYERTVQPQPKLGSWRTELDRLLAVNAARSSRERLTLIRIFEELRALGYAGGYDAVRRYAASWQRQRSPASGWEKGQVENQVGTVRQRFFSPRVRVKSYDELNAWLMDPLHRLGEGASPS